MVQERVKRLEQSLQKRAVEFAEGVRQIRLDLSVGSDLSGEDVAKAQEPSI
jgi:hypothetical protein